MLLTEDSLALAIADFDGKPKKIMCGSRAALNAKRILAEPGGEQDGVPVGKLPQEPVIEERPDWPPEQWQLA